MTEQQPIQGEQTPTADPQNPPTGATQPGTEQGPIPYQRFKEVNDQLKELKDWKTKQEKEAEKRNQEAKTAEDKRLAEQQEFQTLAEKRKAELDEATTNNTRLQEQLDKQTTVLTALYEGRKALVPEMFQPLLDSMDVVDRLDWLAKNEKQLKPQSNGGIPHTPQPQGRGEITPEERRRKAARII